MAIDHGKAHKKLDWDSITKQYVTYITPEKDAQGYLMAMDEEEGMLYETIYQPIGIDYLEPL
jgi:hypothetical protein